MIIIAVIGLALPLAGLSGTHAAWGLLPFALAAVVALAWAIERNHRDRSLVERLDLWPSQITVSRHEADGTVRTWQANPYWVSIHLHEDAQIEKYITLKGNNREIELGAFLSPWEREQLYADLSSALAEARTSGL